MPVITKLRRLSNHFRRRHRCHKQYTFLIEDADWDQVNAIRDTLMVDIPAMAFTIVIIKHNDALTWCDSSLCHRICMLRLDNTDVKNYVAARDCFLCFPVGNAAAADGGGSSVNHCPRCSVHFHLDVRHDSSPPPSSDNTKRGGDDDDDNNVTIVTTNDLINKTAGSRLRVVVEDATVVLCKTASRIELDAYAQRGTGSEHAKFASVAYVTPQQQKDGTFTMTIGLLDRTRTCSQLLHDACDILTKKYPDTYYSCEL